jgi:hypothetical protein
VNPALDLFQSVGGALLALAVIAVVGWVAITRIRAWMRSTDDTDEGFTLADLRRLRHEGALSEEEFERAQQQLISAVRTRPSRKEAPSTKGPGPRRERPLGAAGDPRADERIDLLREAEPSAPAKRLPRVESDADGRIVIRDEPPHDSPKEVLPPPVKPKMQADPRTDERGP